MTLIVALTLATLTTSATALSARGNGFLSADMHPDAVAKLLSNVEDTWKTKAHDFNECIAAKGVKAKAECSDSMGTFAKSCGKLAQTIVQNRFGLSDEVKVYMDDVCSRTSTGWHQATCATFGQMMTHTMALSEHENLQHFDG